MPRSNVTGHVVGMLGPDLNAWPPPVIDNRSVDQHGCTAASTTLVDARPRACGKSRWLMDPRRLARTTLLPAVAVILALATTGATHAYWGGSGGGAGSGAAGATVAVSLSPGTPSATLLPGGQADVELSISNPNTLLVHVGALALDTGQGTGGFAVDAGHSGCAVATLSFTTQTNGGAGWTVPAKVGAVDGTLDVTLTNALAMGLGAANACQGASATVYLAASP